MVFYSYVDIYSTPGLEEYGNVIGYLRLDLPTSNTLITSVLLPRKHSES